MGLTLAVAVVYIKFSAKTYRLDTAVLIKTERSNAFGAQGDDLMKVYELIEQDKNLQNEIFYMRSTPLIRSVLEEMDLLVSYYLQEDKIPKRAEFSMKDLYKNAPFIVIPDNKHYQPVGSYIWIKVLNEQEFRISAEDRKAMIVDYRDESVVYPEAYFSLSGTFKFGDVIETPYTSFRVVLNSNYTPESYQGKDLFFKFNTLTNLAAEYQERMSVDASVLEATMVDISMKNSNMEKGLEFLRRLIQKYIDNNLDQKNFLAKTTIEHIDYQISDISGALGSSERELQNIRRSSNVMDIDEKAQNIYDQRTTFEMQEDEIQRRLNYLQQMDRHFTVYADSSNFLPPSAMGLDDPLLSGLIQELTTLNSERQQLISNNQLRSPRLRSIEVNIGNLKRVISENIRYSISATRSELNDVRGKISNLNQEFAQLPQTQRQLVGVQRKFELNNEVYMSLLEKRIQAEIIRASNLPDCEIIEPPHYAGIHSPKKIIILLGALILGFMVPVMIILGRKLFFSVVMDREELKSFTSFPTIGSIPQSQRASINVIADQPNSITAEAFLSVRSNLIYYLMGKLNRVILVTSSMAGEGKSFASLNIASSLATTNNKTLLIEFDLRRPSELYTKLNIRGLIGVSSYLINKATLEEITIQSEVENLDIMLAGKIPPNPIELISSKKTQELFEELRKRYDYIIIDTPPYGMLTDSFVLMSYADIVLYVTRLGTVKRKLFASVMEDLTSKQIDKVHLLINGDHPTKRSYGKYYTKEPSLMSGGQRRKKPRKEKKPRRERTKEQEG